MLTAEFITEYTKEYEKILSRMDHWNLRCSNAFKTLTILDGSLFFKLLDKDQQFFLDMPFEKISDVDYAFYYSTNPDCLKERRSSHGNTFEYYYGVIKKQPTSHVKGNHIVCLYCKKQFTRCYSDYNLDFYVGHLFPLLVCERCFYKEDVVPEKALSFYNIYLILYIMENARCTVLDWSRSDFRDTEKLGVGASLQMGVFKNMPTTFVMRGRELLFENLAKPTI